MSNFIEIKNDKLNFTYSELGQQEVLELSFNRTLRIPDDNKKYPLPPGIGSFPLSHVQDYQNNVPQDWNERGGILLPMYQAEAMWMSFKSKSGRPYAIKIATGKINALSGESWSNELQKQDKNNEKMQDYLIAPNQLWLDGFNVGKGVIRQFVAAPLGKGYTVEEQVTGNAEFGGIQIIVYPMKEEEWAKIKPKHSNILRAMNIEISASAASISGRGLESMGLGAGGMMEQEIYEDSYGFEVWDTKNPLRVFVNLLNSLDYEKVTGNKPPTTPPTSATYRQYKYPWFEYYGEGNAIDSSKILSKVDSIGSLQVKKGETILPDEGIGPSPEQKPHILGTKKVHDKKW